jgi:co-chaperonin GroES (HSP10)
MTAKAAFSAHRIDRNQLKPLRNAVIVSEMNFEERLSTGGIVLVKDNGKSSGIRPRWGRVYAVGPEQHDVKVGTWICVEHGRWTRGIDIEDENGKQTLRRVDPKDIMMESDEMPQDVTFSDAIHVEAKPSWMQHN